MRNRRVLFRMIVLYFVLAPLCGCDILKLGNDRHVDIQSRLDNNRKKWDSEMVSNYQFDFQWSCYCIVDFVAQVNITVRDNQIHSAAFVEGDVPIPHDIAIERYQAMDGLFDLLQSAIDANAHTISAKYHFDLGYPTEVWIDYEERTADEERGFSIHNLILE